jgi:16S rRNA (uracil1498-N3)-methyltransferase
MSIPNTRRFFVAPEALASDDLLISDATLAHQLGRVLRLGPGDHVLLLDGLGEACVVELAGLSRDQVRGHVIERGPGGGEPQTELTLYLALLRAERFEWALQKGTELGVRRFVPVQFAHSLAADRADEKKLSRWRRIIGEAAEQACRGRLPTIDPPLGFAAACAQAAEADLPLILWEGEAPSLRSLLRSRYADSTTHHPPPTTQHVALLSGPEGGIAPHELTAAGERGIMAASLGPRILRAETAPLAAAAALFYELEREG